MALESFYGGKQGVSPVIKASFEYVNTQDPAYTARLGHETKPTEAEKYRLKAASIDYELTSEGKILWTADLLAPLTMDVMFSRVDYTDVWYGELCIIDTQNKLNPNNGKIFRRTLKRYKNPEIAGLSDTDALYAEYIGQIVGPSGGVPNLDLGSLNDERKKAIGKLRTFDTDPTVDETHPIDNTNWDYAYPTEQDNGEFLITTEKPTDIDDIALLKMGDGKNIEMVPGWDGNIFNDTIEYTWCNVRRNLDNSNEDSALIYLGFKIPYVSYTVTGTEEYYTYSGEIFEDKSSTPDKEDYHPFYKEYTFHIPRGARGIGPEKFFLVTPDNKNSILGTNILYDFDAIKYNQTTDKYSIDTNKTKAPTSDTYWVGMWTLYNPKTSNKTSVYQYLGDYKDIKSVRVETDKSLPNYGQIYITYSNDQDDETKIDNKLPLPKNISYNNDGTLRFEMADGATITTDGTFKELSEIKIEGNNIYAQYSTDDSTPPNNPIDNPGNWHLVGTLDNSGEDFNPTQIFIGDQEQATTKIRFLGFTPPNTDSVELPRFWIETV